MIDSNFADADQMFREFNDTDELIYVNKTFKTTTIKIPFGVRCVIYSFLDLMSLLNTITKLSKIEREKITTQEVIDQPRCLRIYIKQGKMIQFPQLEYCTKLATKFEL